MQQLNEFQTYLHNLVSSLNTALVLSRKLGEKGIFEYAVKIDHKRGYLLLDVISNTEYKYTSSFIENTKKELVIRKPCREMAIFNNPVKVLYTFDTKTYNINIVRSHRISASNAFVEINALMTQYDLDSNYDPIIFYHNVDGIPSPRDVTFNHLAKNMYCGDLSKSWIGGLNLGADSYIVPTTNADHEVDGIIYEINGLINNGCSNVGVKFITVPHKTNDIMFARNTGEKIDIAPINHNSVAVPEDYYSIILNGGGLIPTKVYKDITESKDD